MRNLQFGIFCILASLGLSLTGCNQNADQAASQTLFKAESYLHQGQLNAAAIEAQNALQSQSTAQEANMILGEVAWLMGDFKNAYRYFKDSNKLQSIPNQAMAFIRLKQFTKAKALLEKYKDKLKASEDFHHAFGELYFGLDDLEKSRVAFEKALKLKANHSASQLGLAKIAMAMGNPEKIDYWLTEAIGPTESYTPALILKGQYLLQQNKPQEAERALSSALLNLKKYDLMTPEKYITLSELAEAMVDQGRVSESLRIRKQLKDSPHGQLKSRIDTAVKAYTEGDYHKATEVFTDVLSLAPDHKESSIALGLLKYQSGDIKAAEHLLAKGINGKAKIDAHTYKTLAMSRIKLGQYAEADTLVTQAMKSFPNDQDLITIQAVILLNKGQKKAAKQIFLEQIQGSKPNPVALTMLGHIALEEQKIPTARDYFNKAIQHNANQYEAYQGLLLSYKDNLAQAKKAINSIIVKQNPVAASANFALGAIEYSQKNYAAAVEIARPLMSAKHPGAHIQKLHANGLFYLASETFNDGNTEEAYALLEESLTNPRAMGQAATLYTKIGISIDKLDQTLETMEAFEKITPNKGLASELLADLAITAKDNDKAIDYLENAWRINKNYRMAMKIFTLKKSLKATDDYTKPMEHITQWVDAAASNLKLKDTKANQSTYEQSLFAKASVFEMHKANTQAIEVYRKLLALNEKSALYHNNLAWLLFLEQKPEAVQFAQQAFTLEPSSPDILDTYGWILFKSGQIIQAKELLTKAAKMAPNNKTIQAHYQKILQVVPK